MLSEEWRMQKENLESKLAYSVEQCKTLANSLNNATEDLRNRRLKSLENETRLIKANEDLQWRYETKLQELKDLLNVTQSDLTSKVCEEYLSYIYFVLDLHLCNIYLKRGLLNIMSHDIIYLHLCRLLNLRRKKLL